LNDAHVVHFLEFDVAAGFGVPGEISMITDLCGGLYEAPK